LVARTVRTSADDYGFGQRFGQPRSRLGQPFLLSGNGSGNGSGNLLGNLRVLPSHPWSVARVLLPAAPVVVVGVTPSREVAPLVVSRLGFAATHRRGACLRRAPEGGVMKVARLTLTVTEAAEVLGISRTLAYEMVQRGELPHVRLGRRLVVPVRALERMLGIEDAESAAGCAAPSAVPWSLAHGSHGRHRHPIGADRCSIALRRFGPRSRG